MMVMIRAPPRSFPMNVSLRTGIPQVDRHIDGPPPVPVGGGSSRPVPQGRTDLIPSFFLHPGAAGPGGQLPANPRLGDRGTKGVSTRRGARGTGRQVVHSRSAPGVMLELYGTGLYFRDFAPI